jgi:NAD-dependent SIR2 family protein deacetylase
MTYLDTGTTQQTVVLKTALDKAEAVIIGAGSGMSNAGGLRYDDTGFFNATFPGYQDCYSLRTINEADFYRFPKPEEQYAYWTRLISAIRYNHPPGKPYHDLHCIIKDKNHFILTTNTDGQFQKAGFCPENICTPQGDLAFFQCSKPCNDTIYPNEKIIQKMLASLAPQDFTINPEHIPHCPACGSPLIPNVRRDENFIEKPWIGQYQKLHNFIHARKGKNILLLELGVGINTPGIIRYPFEHLTLQRNNTFLIRINLKTDNLSLLANSNKAAIIQADIGLVLNVLSKNFT